MSPFDDTSNPQPMSGMTLADLAELPRWVAWQTENRTGGKPTKVPYSPAGPKARADAPRTWGTRAAAEARVAKLPLPYGQGGVGIELGELGDGVSLGGIDLDTCRSNDGTLAPWAEAIIDRFASYAEVSPSQTGIKVFFAYDSAALPPIQALTKTKTGKKWAGSSGVEHPPAIELYVTGRYFAVTDRALPESPDLLRTVPLTDLEWLIRDFGPAAFPAASKPGAQLGKDNSRSAKALSIAIKMRRAGKSFADFLAALYANPGMAAWCRDKGEASGQRELKRAWTKAGAQPSDIGGCDLTEDGIALAFAEKHKGGLRFCHTQRAWYHWTSGLWRLETTALAFSWARQLCREIAKADDPTAKTAAVMARASTAAAVERFAQSDRAFAVTGELWDQDGWKLGTPGGRVDLKIATLNAASQTDYITKSTAVTPAVTPDCPIWHHFLQDATAGDAGLIRFLRQWCGYMLTGDTREHALLFICGPGGNGKGVFLNTVSGILGDYARTAAMDSFTATRTEKHPTDLAMLKGARMVCASETEEGRAWAEARIKAMTGGDVIAARFMARDFFEYRPQFKLVIIGNHRPVLRNVDDAARRRFNIVPFEHKPPNPDRELEDKLRAEWPAILRWMIEGCIDWQMHGLVRPRIVTDATAEYFADQDVVAQWIEDDCDVSAAPPHFSATNGALFASWRIYALGRGEEPGGSGSFRDRLKQRGFRPIKDQAGIRGRGFIGIRVRDVWTPEGDRT